MYVQVEKPKKNKSLVVENSIAQKKNNGKQCVSFVNNRSESIAQGMVVQRVHSQANWIAMNNYGTAGEEVEKAFTKVGYVAGAALQSKIISLIKSGGFGSSLFGHSSSSADKDAGTQGDTYKKIEECKKYLIQWAEKNPYSTSNTTIGSGYKVTEEVREQHKKNKQQKSELRKNEKRQQWEQNKKGGGGGWFDDVFFKK